MRGMFSGCTPEGRAKGDFPHRPCLASRRRAIRLRRGGRHIASPNDRAVATPADRVSLSRSAGALRAGVDMSVEADGPLIIHLDGELWARPDDGVTMVTIELLLGALQVCR